MCLEKMKKEVKKLNSWKAISIVWFVAIFLTITVLMVWKSLESYLLIVAFLSAQATILLGLLTIADTIEKFGKGE